jgi:hypothetical protein
MSFVRRYVCRLALLIAVLALTLPVHVGAGAAMISHAKDHHSAEVWVEHPSALADDAVSGHNSGEMAGEHDHASVCESGHCCTFTPISFAPSWQGNHVYAFAANGLVYLHSHRIDPPPPKRA